MNDGREWAATSRDGMFSRYPAFVDGPAPDARLNNPALGSIVRPAPGAAGPERYLFVTVTPVIAWAGGRHTMGVRVEVLSILGGDAHGVPLYRPIAAAGLREARGEAERFMGGVLDDIRTLCGMRSDADRYPFIHPYNGSGVTLTTQAMTQASWLAPANAAGLCGYLDRAGDVMPECYEHVMPVSRDGLGALAGMARLDHTRTAAAARAAMPADDPEAMGGLFDPFDAEQLGPDGVPRSLRVKYERTATDLANITAGMLAYGGGTRGLLTTLYREWGASDLQAITAMRGWHGGMDDGGDDSPFRDGRALREAERLLDARKRDVERLRDLMVSMGDGRTDPGMPAEMLLEDYKDTSYR